MFRLALASVACFSATSAIKLQAETDYNAIRAELESLGAFTWEEVLQNEVLQNHIIELFNLTDDEVE